MNESIIIKSPTRVDLAGGTLDLWPLYNFVGDALTINIAIDIWTKVELKKRDDGQVKFFSKDLSKEWHFKQFSAFMTALDPQLILFQKIFDKFLTNDFTLFFERGFEMTTSSESPIGGGLGGSSSLIISIIKAIHHLANAKTPNVHNMVWLAHNIEAEILRTPTGTQDYYPAVTGGLNRIKYTANGIELETQSIDQTPFNDHFLLIYTGRTHHSGLNNFEVLKSAVEGDVKVLDALKKIKDISNLMSKVIFKSDWDQLPNLFIQEYEARLQLTPAFSSPEIEKLSDICLNAGALGIKICGAGGGGCVMVWVHPLNREKVVQVCQNEKFQCLNARPVNPLN